MMNFQDFRQQFRQLYGNEPRLFSAPGRVNLIGEHTDYNDGFVLPMAIDRRTLVAMAPRNDGRVRCLSTEFDQQVEFELNADLKPDQDWANHVRGVAVCLLRDKYNLRGADLLIASEVPLGAGLSSSAALEIAVGYGLLKLAEQPVDPVRLALAAQKAEHEFAGTQCGVMDQFIACLAREGHALKIDCRTLEYEAVPVDLSDARVVVVNSMVKHELASSEYNQRRAECEDAVRRLSGHLPGIQSLRDVELEEFDQWAGALPEPIRRRANHVITENARTLVAVEALKLGQLSHFGNLMKASHESLREDYQVSCRELDLLVEIAGRHSGVFGARMTGGGFGGCTVNLVKADQVETFTSETVEAYRWVIGVQPEIYICQASGAVREENQ